MSSGTTLVICDSRSLSGSANKYTCLPQIRIPTLQKFQEYFSNLPGFVFIIILFFSSSNQILAPILEETKKKQDQIINIFCCFNPYDALINNRRNVVHISEYLIRYEINKSFYNFLKLKSEQQFQNDNGEVGYALHKEALKTIEYIVKKDEVEVCHILIIPLNTNKKNLESARRRLQKLCDGLFNGAYKFKIFTLYDIIPADESDPDIPGYTRFFEYKHREDICKLIQRSSFIRMYLVGNDSDISNKWSKKLIANELDIDHEFASKYEDRCIFIENWLCFPMSIQGLIQQCGRLWQMSSVKVMKMKELRDDPVFSETLQRIYGCLENRKMAVNAELHQGKLESDAFISEYSTNMHDISEANGHSEEKVEIGDLFSKISPI